jgi:hypothetical protein
MMIFEANKINGQIISGQQIVRQLKQSLKTDSNFISPEVISLETYGKKISYLPLMTWCFTNHIIIT